MQNHLRNLLWLNKDVNFIIPSAGLDDAIEHGKVIEVKNGLRVRSYVDGYVHDLYFSDIVNFKNKGINTIWQTEILIHKSLSKVFKIK